MQEALDYLSLLFRDHPTVPCDPANPEEEFPLSASDDTALLLSCKHCAFKGCSWVGTDAASQVDHLLQVHEEEDLREAMTCFQALRPNVCSDARVLAMSVYNEGIAIAVRKGAPLASYSIDRRCLKEYMTSLTYPSTNALVCLLCARRFTHIHRATDNKIAMRPLITKVRDVKTLELSTRLLNLEKKCVCKLFGLRKYCDTYGRMSDSLTLGEHDKQFDDWHVRVALDEEEVKVLCCPEDVICGRLDGHGHSSTECCDDCSAPICKECAHDLDGEVPSLPPAALANDMMIY